MLLLGLLWAQYKIPEKAFNWSLVGWAMTRNCWGSLVHWNDRGSLLSKKALLLQHVSVVWAFLLKKNASYNKQRKFFFFFSVVVLLLKDNLCLSFKHSQVENLFISLRAFTESKMWHFRTVFTLFFTVVNNVLRDPYLLLTNSSLIFRLPESQGMFYLGHFVFQNSKVKFKSQLNVINPCSVFW